jgi:hypothetical protein
MSVIMFDIKRDALVHVELIGLLDKLYHLEIRVPTVKDVKNYMVKNTDDITKYFNEGIETGIRKIKKTISKIDEKIPLFDIYTMNIYLIDRTQIYDKIMIENNRFPDQRVVDALRKRSDDLSKQHDKISKDIEVFEKKMKSNGNILTVSKEEYQAFQDKKINIVRTYEKINLGLSFLDSFILSVLETTYMRALYMYTTELGENLTFCGRPSFTYRARHLTPYYTRSEVINLAKNMGIVKSKTEYDTQAKIDKLCRRIAENDINANILIEHQTHIVKNKMLGLVQYYSLQGSYFMNQYLRGTVDYDYKNPYIESLIEPMIKLIHTAPKFDKNYILYRFIQTDEHLSHLTVGDVYTEKGFTSTTRDPFYQSEDYKFGWILLKIKLPSSQRGIALCIETISHFPKEQEIILTPNTQFKLISKDDHSVYYHIDPKIGNKIKGIYEFEVIGRSEIIMPDRMIYETTQEPIDFLKIKKIDALTIEEKIHRFINHYVNPMHQFEVVIGDKKLTVMSEWYDGTGVYKKYYALTSKNGYSLYTLYKNHLLFIIELGQEYNSSRMFVNFHVKYTTLDRDNEIGSENFLKFIASIAYYFDIESVVLYADYVSCDYVMSNKERFDTIEGTKSIRMFGGTYCVDFYDYLKHGKKKYSDLNILGTELMPQFKYHMIDLIKKIKPDLILHKFDVKKKTYDKLYQIYDQTYKPFVPEINNTLDNFYIWITENHCFLLNELIEQFNSIPEYITDNPFQTDYYIFNAVQYLYNKSMIKYIPMSVNDVVTDNAIIKTKGVRINRYRLTENQRRRNF